MDRIYLEHGLTALSRASKTDPNHGHWGAAVLAAYYFSHENQLRGLVARAHRAQVDELIRTFAPYFEKLPKSSSDPALANELTTSLARNIGQLRAIGHNVIFATLALKALRDEPSLCTRPVVDGILALIHSYDEDGPGSNFPGWSDSEIEALMANPGEAPPEWSDPLCLAKHALSCLLEVETIFRGAHAGVVGHVLTHADALTELSRLGEHELARRGHTAYLVHATIATRIILPGSGSSPRSPARHGVLTDDYWRQSLKGRSNWSYGHKFKYPYSFFRLARRVDDPEISRRGDESLKALL